MITKLVMGLVLCASLALSQTAPAPEANRDSSNVDAKVRQLLNAQVEAWNRGDVEGFMSGYWHSRQLTFFSNTTETKGWEPTLKRYKARYQGEHRTMGKLDFTQLEISALGEDAALVRGHWHLLMPDGKEPHGIFTLVLRRFPGEGWKVVHDHTSGE